MECLPLDVIPTPITKRIDAPHWPRGPMVPTYDRFRTNFGGRLKNYLADNVPVTWGGICVMILKHVKDDGAPWYEVSSAQGDDCGFVHYHFIVYKVATCSLDSFGSAMIRVSVTQ